VTLYAAIELSPGQAAEALSRLNDEGYLREVRGELEFRNELIRAQAYYAVAGTARQHLHRRVADLLSNGHSKDDRAVFLEIAWHHLRGGDAERAVPFAIEGAEAVLAVGAPHGAEEVLRAIINLSRQPENEKQVHLLLARSLIDQSKADPALPIIDRLGQDNHLNDHDHAELAMLRATAEFLLNRGHGTKYSEVSRTALAAARKAGDPNLVTQALFECARAGSEEGSTELIEEAERGLDQLGEKTDLGTLAMGLLTKAFCRFSLFDPAAALANLDLIVNATFPKSNAARLAFVYSGMGIANHFLGRLEAAGVAFEHALDLARKVGDDARVSQISANLCTLKMNLGQYEDAIYHGELSVRLGEAADSTTLLTCYTNLMDPYILTGKEEAAMQCLEKARKWLVPERRWKLRCAFLVEAASFALIQRNQALALDLIAQLETLARGRENVVPNPGPYWKLIVFRKAVLGRSDEARGIIGSCEERWRTVCPFHFLDIVAARAWLERHENGTLSEQAERDLDLFEDLKAIGRKALFAAQGFLTPLSINAPMKVLGTNVQCRSDQQPFASA
jgi:tetratricopeptide (TPR) repeat protein